MGLQLQNILSAKNGRNFGEPWSLDQLEQIPHLHHIAYSIRAAISATNKNLRETEFHNRLIYQNFVSMLNNDVIFRLLVTNQFYLLGQLFEDPLDELRLEKLIERIERHYKWRHKVKQQWDEVIIRENLSRAVYRQEDNDYLLQWTHPDPGLSNIEKWFHYEEELQRITFVYHAQKAKIFHHYGVLDLDRIASLLTILKKSGSQYEGEIKALEAIQCEYTAKLEGLMNRPLYREDGSYDLQAAELQASEMEEAKNQISAGLDKVFEPFSSVHQIFGRFKIQHERAKIQCRDEVSQLDSVFEAQTSLLREHQQEVYSVTKQEALDNLSDIIQEINSLEPQSDEHISLIKKLKLFQQNLNETDSFDSMQRILKSCQEELIRFDDIIPVASYPRVQSSIEALGKIVIQSRDEFVERVNQSSMASEMNNRLPSYEESISLPSYQVHDLPPPYEVEEPPPVYQEVADQRVDIEPSAPAMPENQVQSTQRLEQPDRLASSVRSVSQVGMFAPASQGLKQREIALRLISNKIEKIMNYGESQVQEAAQEFNEQILQVKRYANYEEVPNDLKKSFSDSLSKLGHMDNLFEALREKYASLFQPDEEANYQSRT